MGVMKLCLVFLLCILAVRQWIACEASRKMPMEVEVGGTGGFSTVSRKILSEQNEDTNDMETELILPDEVGSGKLEQQTEPVEKLKKKKKKKQEGGDGDLLSEQSQAEKLQKKKKKQDRGVPKTGKVESFTEQESSVGQLTGESLLEEEKLETGVRKKLETDVRKTARSDMEESSQALEEDPSLEMVKADEVEDLPTQSDIAETEIETGGGSFLSEVGEEEVGKNAFKEKMQAKELQISNKQQASVDAQEHRENKAKEKPKKSNKEEVEGALQAKQEKADLDEASNGTAQDEKPSKGEAVADEITDEITPADIIEREMQGGGKDVVTQAVEEETFVEKKQRTEKEADKTLTEEQGRVVDAKQTESQKAKKKPKKLKTAKSEEVSEEGDADSKGSKYFDGGKKQGETQDTTAKPMLKKKKKVKASENREEEKPSESERAEVKETEEGSQDSKVENNADAKVVASKQQQSEDEKLSEGTDDEFLTVEKQEEKVEAEVQTISKEAQERAEGFVSTAKALSSSAQGVDEDDDEYDFMQDFSDFSTNFQDTALKVADHLGPNIQKITDTSKGYFNKYNQQITESFSPVVGKQFAPFFASLVSYGLLLVPLAVVILLFERIRALLSVQKVLLFVNIYLAAYFASLLLATFVIGEPMFFFYKSSTSGYVHLQLLQALGYIVYLVLQTYDMVTTLTSETVPIKVTVVLQWLVALTVGFHYYVTIFHRAMASKGPHTNWKIYGVYSIAFLVLCLFARIQRVKKGYSQLGQADTDKKH